MLNKYPLWKYLLILSAVGIGFFYAAANLFAPDPAIQISGESSAALIDERALAIAVKALDKEGIEYFGETVGANGGSALFRLRDREQQLPA